MNLTDIYKVKRQKDTLIEKLEHWWSYTKTYRFEIPYYDFKKGISNLYKWFKIVWKDNDFGYDDIIKIWRFKLEKTANEFERKYNKAKSQNKTYYDDLLEQIKWMRLCCRLIDKIWSNNLDGNIYSEEYTLYYKNEYVWQPCVEDLEKYKDLAKAINRDKKIESILNDTYYDEIDLESEIELDIFDLESDKAYNLKTKTIFENFDDYFEKNKLSFKKAKLKTGSNDKYHLAMTISDMKHKKAKKLLFKIIEQKIENWID
jgi:hypothetical protein